MNQSVVLANANSSTNWVAEAPPLSLTSIYLFPLHIVPQGDTIKAGILS